MRQTNGRVFISWRILRSDRTVEPFSIFRNGQQLNEHPLVDGGSFFIDEQPLADQDAVYEVKGGGIDGRFILRHDAPLGYLPIPLEKPDGGTTPDGRRYFYSANDASVADVDGDGQYELILKWEPSNAHDNAHDGFTGPTLIDCYKLFSVKSLELSDISYRAEEKSLNTQHSTLNSQLLWRINLGRNIRSGAHYVPFIVYDFDGDGRAELMVKTADGTRDGQGAVIGDSTADYRYGVAEAMARLPKKGRILEGAEYITVFDGQTGRALDTKPYIPERGELKSWGDDRGNRSERYLAALGYLDGRRASALFCRGYYTRTVIVAWDWDGHQLKGRWAFDTNNPEWRDYAGQGNHNLRVADVDGDGCDELTYGAMAVDNDGRGLYNTGMGHGDALHLVADPQADRLYIWDCHENRRDGSELRDARTGEIVFQIKSRSDVGRALAADIDPTSPGVEMWSTDSHGIRNMKGESLTPDSSPREEGGGYSQEQTADHKETIELNNPFARRRGGRAVLSINFAIWWDGDLLRELLDHETVTKYDWEKGTVTELQRLDGRFNNGTKSNPCLQADILGDWREEVIVRNEDSTELRLYTTTIPTQYRINCLMQDIPYRLSVATENVGYNQPPEAGFYIGPDKTDYLK